MAAERSARVARIVEHAADTRSVFLEPLDGAPVVFRPGQFLSVLVPSAGGDLNRPYSIASSPGDAAVELLLNIVPGGPGSTYLFGRAPGDRLRVTGPWGTFTADEVPDAEVVFVAERTGIAPIRPILHDLVRRAPGSRLRLLYGATLALYRDELAALPGVAVDVIRPERMWDEAVRRWVDGDDDRSRHFFVCGVGAPVLALRDRLRAAGYARRAVRYERW